MCVLCYLYSVCVSRQTLCVCCCVLVAVCVSVCGSSQQVNIVSSVNAVCFPTLPSTCQFVDLSVLFFMHLFFVQLSVCDLSVPLFIYPPISLSVYVLTYLSFSLPIYLFFVNLFVCVSVILIHQFICLSMFYFIIIYVCQFIYLSIC